MRLNAIPKISATLVCLFFLAVPSSPAGERRFSLVRRDGVAITIPAPEGNRRFRLTDESADRLRFQGRWEGEDIEAEATITDSAGSYLKFAHLKNELLGFSKDGKKRPMPPGRREETRSLGETSVYLAVLSKTRASPGRDKQRGGGRTRLKCVSHIFLYSGTVSLSLTSDDANEERLAQMILAWTNEVMRANPSGVAPKHEIILLDPSTMRLPFLLPLPNGLERVFEFDAEGSLPVIGMYRLNEENPEHATTAATFSLISGKTAGPEMFDQMLRVSEKVFLRRPEGKLVRREKDFALYSFAAPDRRWEGLTLFCLLQGHMVAFDMTYPYGNRVRARQVREALLEWADETKRRNASFAPQPGRPGNPRHPR